MNDFNNWNQYPGTYRDPEGSVPDYESLCVRLRQFRAELERIGYKHAATLNPFFGAELNLRGEKILCAVAKEVMDSGALVIFIRGHISPYLKWNMVATEQATIPTEGQSKRFRLSDEDRNELNSINCRLTKAINERFPLI